MSDENKDFDGIKYRVETSSPAVFRILFTVLVLWGVCYMGYYLFSGWSSEAEFARSKQAKQAGLAAGQPAEGKAPAAATAGKEDTAAIGKKEYAERCAACHGADAKGGIGPDLTRKEFSFGRNAAAIAASITNGRPGGMPSFKSDLSHEKVEALVKYILSL